MRREANNADRSHKDRSPATIRSEPWTPFHDSRPLQRKNRRGRHIRRSRSRRGRIDNDRSHSRSHGRRTRDPSQGRPRSRSRSRGRRAKHTPRVRPGNGRSRPRDNHDWGRQTGIIPRNGLCDPREGRRDSRSFSRDEKSLFRESEATHTFPDSEVTPRTQLSTTAALTPATVPDRNRSVPGVSDGPTTASVAPTRHPGRTPGEWALFVASIFPSIRWAFHGTSLHPPFYSMGRVSTGA